MYNRSEKNRQIGCRVKTAREAVGCTQAQLAEESETSPQYISDLERGIVGVSGDSLSRICEALSASADYILFGREPTPQVQTIMMKLDGLDDDQLSAVGDMIDAVLRLVSKTEEDSGT